MEARKEMNKQKKYTVSKYAKDKRTQIGTYDNIEEAINLCQFANPYSVYDSEGNQIYPKPKEL